jgi:hypothetical protein
MDIPAAGGGVRELFCGSRDSDDISGVIGAHAERRAGAALAVDAVTGNDYPGWFFRKRERDCTAAAPGVAHRNSLHRLPKPNLKRRHYPFLSGRGNVEPAREADAFKAVLGQG